MADSVKKEFLKNAFNCISKDEVEKINGGASVPPGGGDGKPGDGKPGVGPLPHSCSSLGTIDCWCEPHCVSGKTCTSGWY